jgi:hypothetical protein
MASQGLAPRVSTQSVTYPSDFLSRYLVPSEYGGEIIIITSTTREQSITCPAAFPMWRAKVTLGYLFILSLCNAFDVLYFVSVRDRERESE